MKLKEFLKNIEEMVKQDKSLLELDVIYSKDDEGNGFQEVGMEPSLGNFDGEDFYQNANEESDFEINAICIN